MQQFLVELVEKALNIFLLLSNGAKHDTSLLRVKWKDLLLTSKLSQYFVKFVICNPLWLYSLVPMRVP